MECLLSHKGWTFAVQKPGNMYFTRHDFLENITQAMQLQESKLETFYN